MEQWISGSLDKAEMIASAGLCDHCLGRMFAKCGEHLSDEQRGGMLREGLRRIGKDFPPRDPCPLCEGLFSMVPRFAAAAAEKVNGTVSDNFLIGCRVDPEQAQKERDMWGEFGVKDTAEPLKTELNREIGKVALPMINRTVEFKEPQVVAVVDTRFAEVTLDISPIFIAGRYNKLNREIPQTKWPCRICNGKGCPRCHGTGKMYQTSVQEIIGDPALRMAKGQEHFFHGMGREDIDALMLGEGRPFVLEISRPMNRDIDLGELENEANDTVLAQYRGLHFVPRSAVAAYKESDPDKTYRARVIASGPVVGGRVIAAAESFADTVLDQRTPRRVEHRRTDLVRNRKIYWVRAENIKEDSFDLVMKTQSGTYVKEFVSGDEGRTRPNFSDRLGIPCRVDLLDVQEIDYREDEAYL